MILNQPFADFLCMIVFVEFFVCPGGLVREKGAPTTKLQCSRMTQMQMASWTSVSNFMLAKWGSHFVFSYPFLLIINLSDLLVVFLLNFISILVFSLKSGGFPTRQASI